jgi:polyprenyl P-hydroxybenzoate/phenylacrylic acid decarboxylase-like protein
VNATATAADIVATGDFDRFPDLRIVLVHGGGFLPYQAARFDQRRQGREQDRPLPSEVVGSLYYATVLLSAAAVRFLYDYVGSQRVIVGSDFGGAPRERAGVQIIAAVREAGDDDDVTRAVLAGNAQSLFDLRSSTTGGVAMPRRLVVGVTGSSAPQLAISLLNVLRDINDVEVHLVVSRGAERSIELELNMKRPELEALGDVVYDPDDMAAAISSGSFLVDGMVVMPCSMKTLAAVASGVTVDLVARAVDVNLKERRPVVLVPRETPLNLIHIRNMETVTLAGATVLPPVPAFYHQPESVDDLLRQTAGKVLDQFHIEHNAFRRWR